MSACPPPKGFGCCARMDARGSVSSKARRSRDVLRTESPPCFSWQFDALRSTMYGLICRLADPGKDSTCASSRAQRGTFLRCARDNVSQGHTGSIGLWAYSDSASRIPAADGAVGPPPWFCWASCSRSGSTRGWRQSWSTGQVCRTRCSFALWVAATVGVIWWLARRPALLDRTERFLTLRRDGRPEAGYLPDRSG